MNKRKRDDSRLYKKTRSMAIERDSTLGYPMCVLCKNRPAEQVHHIVYRSQLGTSELSNLACLCAACHRKAHGQNGGNAREIRKILLERVKVATENYEKDKSSKNCCYGATYKRY